MVQEKNGGISTDTGPPPIQQNRPALTWELKIKKKLKPVPPCLGQFRPAVGQCCHQCTPDSLRKKPGQNSFIGFHNLLSIKETQTRYRGWLVRKVCCALLVSGCKVYGSGAGNRLEKVCQSNRLKEALTANHKTPEGGDGPGQLSLLTPFLPLINTCISSGLLRFMCWVTLKMFASAFGSIQVNLSHLSALHKASQEGSPLVYVYVRQNAMDYALIPLVLFCHSLRVPYTVCPLHITSPFLRSVLQRVGVILLPSSAETELEAERDPLHAPLMTSLLRELLHEGQALSVGVSAESGQGGQWLARIRQLIKEGSVSDVCLVPVGISYDCVTKTNTKVGMGSLLQWLWSLLWNKSSGSVRIHLAQPFSLKEMCESGRCRADEWLPLQDLLLPVILNNRGNSVFGKRRMSWLLPSSASDPEEQSPPDRDLSVAVILHLIFSATSCMAVMSTSIVSSLLLHRHREGVRVSILCRDFAWLTDELLFRKRDVGFGGTLVEVVYHSLFLLNPHLIIAATPSSRESSASARKDPLIVPRPCLASTLHLSLQAKTVTHSFILEAVGACAVSAMLCEVVLSGVSSKVRADGAEGEEVKGDMEFDVVLGQSELTEKALQLCHLLPPGVMPPCQSSQSFALDAVDSLVRCGILIMEEIPRDVPICDFWKKEGTLSWTTSDDPYYSDSDCEEQDLRSYKVKDVTVFIKTPFGGVRKMNGPSDVACDLLTCALCGGQAHQRVRHGQETFINALPDYMISQPTQCPEMLFFLCSMLAGHLRALCWTTAALELMDAPLAEAEFLSQIHSFLCDMANQKKRHYESCSEEAAHTAVRTLLDLGVLLERRQAGGIFLGVSPLFQPSENRQKLLRFISQYMYN